MFSSGIKFGTISSLVNFLLLEELTRKEGDSNDANLDKSEEPEPDPEQESRLPRPPRLPRLPARDLGLKTDTMKACLVSAL